MKKKYLLITLMLLSIGFAAVATNLYINGTVKITKNEADFNVYYSDAYVNEMQDLTVIESATKISFNTTMNTIGQKYVLDYEVTNGSKNYDAQLTMNCTGDNEYLKVENNFNTTPSLKAQDKRVGKLTLEMIKSNVGDDIPVSITCTLTANASAKDEVENQPTEPEPEEVSLWNYTDLDNSGTVTVGDVYTIMNESFNVISQTNTTVTMLAKYNLDTTYHQSTISNRVKFNTSIGWEYTPGPREIDIQKWTSDIKPYINTYVAYLAELTEDTTIQGDLITLSQLKSLGCSIPSDYVLDLEESTRTCTTSKHKDWIINGQDSWTKSARTDYTDLIWALLEGGDLFSRRYNDSFNSVRPVITISKETLAKTKIVLTEQKFCENKGYSYGKINPTSYNTTGIEYGVFDDAYYLCSNDSNFETEIYGYDKDGNLIYELVKK